MNTDTLRVPQEHAVLSASTAGRWMNCKPSARLNALINGADMEFAAEGRAAHLVAANLLTEALRGKLHDVKWFSSIPNVPQEMAMCAWGYVEYVLGIASSDRFAPNNAKSEPIFVEMMLDLTEWVPEGFGTADAVTWTCHKPDGEETVRALHIIDLKYGKGQAVDAKENPQLMLYALGAAIIMRQDVGRPPDKVTLHIYQPRKGGVSTWTLDYAELLEWGDKVVRPAAASAYTGVGDTHGGEWCQYCAAFPVCCEVERDASSCWAYSLATKALITDTTVSYWLPKAGKLLKWLHNLQEYARKAAISGLKFDGFTLTEGRAFRKWKNPRDAEKAARMAGVQATKLYNPQFVSPAQLEEIMGKEKFESIMGSHVLIEHGRKQLVPVKQGFTAFADDPI